VPAMAEDVEDISPYIDESVAEAIDGRVAEQAGGLIEQIAGVPQEEWDQWSQARQVEANARELQRLQDERDVAYGTVAQTAERVGLSRYDPEEILTAANDVLFQ